jgi:hypothetical protein
VKVLTASAKAATAGLTDTATSARAIAGVLNAYGEKARTRRRASPTRCSRPSTSACCRSRPRARHRPGRRHRRRGQGDIDQLGAAIATMTRAGIVPAEAFTSLNQVLAQIIQPSQTMSGCSTSSATRPAPLRCRPRASPASCRTSCATGGNVTTMSQLFTDIRALRGAMALTTDQGKLYADSIRRRQPRTGRRRDRRHPRRAAAGVGRAVADPQEPGRGRGAIASTARLTAVNGAIRLMRVAIDSEAVASLTRLVGAEGAAAAASSGLTLAINTSGGSARSAPSSSRSPKARSLWTARLSPPRPTSTSSATHLSTSPTRATSAARQSRRSARG